MNLRSFISNNADLVLIRMVQNNSLLQIVLRFILYYNPNISSPGLIQQVCVRSQALTSHCSFVSWQLPYVNGSPPCLQSSQRVKGKRERKGGRHTSFFFKEYTRSYIYHFYSQTSVRNLVTWSHRGAKEARKHSIFFLPSDKYSATMRDSITVRKLIASIFFQVLPFGSNKYSCTVFLYTQSIPILRERGNYPFLIFISESWISECCSILSTMFRVTSGDNNL